MIPSIVETLVGACDELSLAADGRSRSRGPKNFISCEEREHAERGPGGAARRGA